MEDFRTSVCISIDLTLTPATAFGIFAGEITPALAQGGMNFEARENGRITAGEFEVGRVVGWKPGELMQIEWHQAHWKTEEVTNIDVRFVAVEDGTHIVIEHRGWGSLIGGSEELVGWFASAVAAPFLLATAPTGFGNWLTDRRARRPSGAQARAVYRDPLYHYPNFGVILEELALSSDDVLLEVGCGGGALLKEALKSNCRAAAIDHSLEMVQLAKEMNREAIAEGRLEVKQADAHHLPFADTTFTCAAMTGVLGFLPDPVAALREIHRVLLPGGRLVVLGSDPQLKGTAAAPEPMASHLHFYTGEQLGQLGKAAGFARVNVVRRDLEVFARQAGVPEEHIALFAGENTMFLLAWKD